jgi:hypothetical protein
MTSESIALICGKPGKTTFCLLSHAVSMGEIHAIKWPTHICTSLHIDPEPKLAIPNCQLQTGHSSIPSDRQQTGADFVKTISEPGQLGGVAIIEFNATMLVVKCSTPERLVSLRQVSKLTDR